MTEVEFNVVPVRSLFAPRWWQVRRRLAWWRLQRAFERERAALGPAGRQLADQVDAELERAFLFGTAAPPRPLNALIDAQDESNRKEFDRLNRTRIGTKAAPGRDVRTDDPDGGGS